MSDNAISQILALLKAQDEATAHGDAAAVVAAGAPEIVRYDLPPPLEYRGDKERDIAGLEKWFATWDGPVTTEFASPTILIDGDLRNPSLTRMLAPNASLG
jgi:ketosteroid isomerase-like protein